MSQYTEAKVNANASYKIHANSAVSDMLEQWNKEYGWEYVNVADRYGNLLIYEIIKSKWKLTQKIEAINCALSHGADLNICVIRSNNFTSPLGCALKENSTEDSLELTKFLLSRGASPVAPDGFYYFDLTGDIEKLKLLIKWGCNKKHLIQFLNSRLHEDDPYIDGNRCSNYLHETLDYIWGSSLEIGSIFISFQYGANFTEYEKREASLLKLAQRCYFTFNKAQEVSIIRLKLLKKLLSKYYDIISKGLVVQEITKEIFGESFIRERFKKRLVKGEKTIIPDMVFTIPEGFFDSSDEIVEVIIPSDITIIGANAFRNCKNLKYVTFKGNNIFYIGKSAFEGCTSLERIILPSTVNLGERAFADCTSLNNISFISSNLEEKKQIDYLNFCYEKYKSLNVKIPTDNYLLKGDTQDYVYYQFQRDKSWYKYNWGREAFTNCKKISVIEGFDVDIIGEECFKGCYELSSVKGILLDSIEDNAFSNCINLENFILNEDLHGTRIYISGNALPQKEIKNFHPDAIVGRPRGYRPPDYSHLYCTPKSNWLADYYGYEGVDHDYQTADDFLDDFF